MKNYFIGAAFVLSVLSPVFAQASGLDSNKVQAVLTLLSAFGADSATINDVRAVLTDTAPATVTQNTNINSSPAVTAIDTKATTVINSVSLSNIRANIPFSVSGTWSVPGKSLLVLVIGAAGTWADSVTVRANGTWATVPFQNVPKGSYEVTVKDPLNLHVLEKTSFDVTSTDTTPKVELSQFSGSTFPGETVSVWWDSWNVKSCAVMKTVNGGASVLPFGWTTQKAHADIPEGASENPTAIGIYVYTITCATSIGTISKSIQHEVKEVTAGTTDKTMVDIVQTSNTSQSDGTAGEQVMLSWRSTNATSCSLTESINSGTPVVPTWYSSGTAAFKLNGSSNPVLSIVGEHVFAFSCTGPVDSKSNSLKHTVNAIATTSGKPTASLTQSPDITSSTGTVGQPFTLTWSSTDTTSCTMSRTVNEGESATVLAYETAVANHTNGATTMNGSATLVPPLIGVRDYTFSCTGSGGTASAHLTHTVYSLGPVVTLTQSLLTTTSDGKNGLPFTLTWSSTGAASCSIVEVYTDANGKTETSLPTWYAGQLSGTATAVSPAKIGTHEYTFTCTGPTGTASKKLLHTVTPSGTASALDAFTSAASASGTGFSYQWNRDLEIGSPYQDDVTALQTALTMEDVYSGDITGGFYSQTFAAVKAFQVKYEIEATGYVGPVTRAKLNQLY